VTTQFSASSPKLTVVLAAITGAVVCIGLVFNVLSLFLGDNFIAEPSGNRPSDIFFAILGMIASVSCIWFWLRMFADYFRNRPSKNSVAWCWALVLLNVCAALAYFWFIWRPRYVERWPANA
jgi:hypothetical protein